jgi:hypothetical protein
MPEFRIAVNIQAPPYRVWAVMRDIERWPEWTSTVTSVRRLGKGPPGVGCRAAIRQPKLLPAIWRVTEWDEDAHQFTWVTRGPGVKVTARHRVERAGNDSRATLSLEFSGLLGNLVASLTRDLNQQYLTIEANGLRQRSEELAK